MEALIPLTVDSSRAGSALAWADGEIVSLPLSLLHSSALGRYVRGSTLAPGPERLDIPIATIAALRERAAYLVTAPRISRFPISYRLVPAGLRKLAAGLIARSTRSRLSDARMFPRWPLDLSVDFLSDWTSGRSAAHEPAPVLLSHDIDSAEGLRNLVDRFLPLEEAAGARSTSFVVPCAWELDHGLLEEVRARGHRIGIHGYDHSARTPFAPPAERKRRIEAARPLIERYGALGYRAPALVRTRELLAELDGLYRYDSSIPTSGGLFPVPGNGCASARIFDAEGITEVPLSMPRDGSLLFLDHTPAEILELWISCAARIAGSGGIVNILTHCEARFSGNAAMLEAYEGLLAFLAESGEFRWSTFEEVSAA